MPLENPRIVSIEINHIMSYHGHENGDLRKSHWNANLTDEQVQETIFEVFNKAKGYLTEDNVRDNNGVALWDDAGRIVGVGNNGSPTSNVRMYVYVRNFTGDCDVRTAYPY
ncbi:MAG: hypothetical protein VKL59_17690 [Nostocaceae cyanobacterium]|nr:hypothetical protein [Nostocaceae cyanobacterium]